MSAHRIILHERSDWTFTGRQCIVKALQSSALVQTKAKAMGMNISFPASSTKASERKAEICRRLRVHAKYLTHSLVIGPFTLNF
jgi:hypothetical protein